MVDATLKDARIVEVGDHKLIFGAIFGDTKGRFADGERVRTSFIVEGPDENNIVRTRNTTYQLELAA